MKFIEKIFSVKNEYKNGRKNKVITILGLKFKFKVKCKCYGLNLGAGNWYSKGWGVVDWYADPQYIDYKINLLENQNLPIKNNSIKYVFASHLIEHLTDQNDQKLFSEVYRIIRKDGCFRIACPDADKAFHAYKSGNKNFFFLNNEVYLVGDSIERRLVNFFASFKCKNYDNVLDYSGGPVVNNKEVRDKFDTLSASEFINWCKSLIPQEAYYRAHINGFNYNKLYKMLLDAGFSKVYLSSYRESSIPEMRKEHFDNRPNHSLYVEAIK